VTDSPNALRWDGSPGHYEVYYLSLTDAGSGIGLWIRYTMLAPLQSRTGPTCALWLLAMDPQASGAGNAGSGHAASAHGNGALASSADDEGDARASGGEAATRTGARGGDARLARKATFPIAMLRARADPFHLSIGEATFDDRGMAGAIGDVRWELRWEPRLHTYHHVHPLLRRARVAKTVLVLPHADLEVSGTVVLPGRELTLDGARGGQAHLWGSKHAARWAWLHANDFRSLEGEPRRDTFVDAVSVFVPRMGREMGPSTPLVGRVLGEDFNSTSPVRVLANHSHFSLTGWHLEARDGKRRVRVEVDAPRDTLAGVTYHDPDGDLAYCYNSEVATMRLNVWDRKARGRLGWALRETLVADGRAHFEYAQREPVPGMPLLIA
jgi:hypothetical protein